MPLRTSLRTLKSLGIFGSKSKKDGKHPNATSTQPATTVRPASRQDPPRNANTTIRHLKNFDELIKRLHKLFLQYQVPLSEGRPIVFDEVRCSEALNLHLLLSIQAPDLMKSEAMASTFELHNLGLRLPENPLRMNPTYSLKIKIRQALQEELGPVFTNTSLEALGLITVLHVLEKAISWLEPLLSKEGISRVQINVEAAQQPVHNSSNGGGDEKLSDSSDSRRASVNYARRKSDVISGSASNPRRHSQSLEPRFFQTPSKGNHSTDTPEQAQNHVTAPKFSPGHRAYNFNKESPENALDRWVLGVRSHGHEPTLDECIRKLHQLVIKYETARQEPGILPPPVSTRHGRVQHALHLHQQQALQQNEQPLQSDLPPHHRPVQRDAEKLTAEAPIPRPSTPYKHRRTTQHIVQTSSTGVPPRFHKQMEPPMPVVQESPPACKTPRHLLCLNGSPVKSKKPTKMRIGSPSKITHHASGAGLASYDAIVKAMLAANEGFGHPKQIDSITSNLASNPQDNHSNPRKDMSTTSVPAAATRQHTFQSLSNTTSHAVTAHPQYLKTEGTGLHHLPADKHSPCCATTTDTTRAESQAWNPSGQSSSVPHDDQDAKVEALLTQLKLMQDVFEKARDSLGKFVGPRFIERVSDIAVGYGWFRASSKDYHQRSE